jgi:hypothetical protein
MPQRIPEGFVVAMRASVALACEGPPFRPDRRLTDWLIVSRWGVGAEYLTIAFSGVPAGDAEAAPVGLEPQATVLGRLAWEDQASAESIFILLRKRPPGIPLAGEFIPIEGFARVARNSGNGALRLAAAGRHAPSSSGRANGHHVPGDDDRRPQGGGWEVPAEVQRLRPGFAGAGAVPGVAWRLSARQRPWIGEMVEEHDGALSRIAALAVPPRECVALY